MCVTYKAIRGFPEDKEVNEIQFRRIADDYRLSGDIFEDKPKAIHILNTFEKEEQILLILLSECDTNVNEVCRTLGVSRNSLYRVLTPIREEFKRRYNNV